LAVEVLLLDVPDPERPTPSGGPGYYWRVGEELMHDNSEPLEVAGPRQLTVELAAPRLGDQHVEQPHASHRMAAPLIATWMMLSVMISSHTASQGGVSSG
jgi:hypothetical protein